MITRSEYPFFDSNNLPDYERILNTPPIELIKTVKDGLDRAMCLVNDIINNPPQDLVHSYEDATYSNVIHPLEIIFDFVEQLHHPIDHLVMVCENDELCEVQKTIDEVISKFNTDFFQNKKAYELIKSTTSSVPVPNPTFDKIKRDWIEAFERTGIQLSKSDQNIFKQNAARLSELQNTFGTNVVKSRKEFTWDIKAADGIIPPSLSGLTSEDLDLLRTNAKNLNRDADYTITLDSPCTSAILSRCDSLHTRETVYKALTTIASDGQFDNTDIINEIINIRSQQAALLGFPNYGDLSTCDKMAKTAKGVFDFIASFGDIKSLAEKEKKSLHDFAVTHLGIYNIDQVSRLYVIEKMQQHLYNFASADVSKFFPTEQTLERTLRVFGAMYDIKFKKRYDFSSWHPDVQMFDLIDVATQTKIGSLYFDLYARQGKTGGAWMDNVNSKHVPWNEYSCIDPTAHVVCNFAPPGTESPSLMTHSDLETLFHEMGHAMHHLLTKQTSLTISGINGVQWDAVEMPSQLMENWCWNKATLQSLSGHYQTSEQLPGELFDKMEHAFTFCGAIELARRLEQSVFDMYIHTDPSRTIYENLQRARDKYNPIPYPEYNRFAHAFIHIFQAGYAAGYYGYLWAEGLSCDAFGAFEEEGISNKQTADRFRSCILSVGGSVDMAEAFESFRGRPSNVNALLKRNGIVVDVA